MSMTTQATTRDYINDACRIEGSTYEAVFAIPFSDNSWRDHPRRKVLRLAKQLAADDGASFTREQWATGRGDLPVTRRANIQHIIDSVCEYCLVTREDIAGRCKHDHLILARMLIAKAARKATMLSYPEITRAMGRTAHSAVIESVQRFDHNEPMDPRLTAALSAVFDRCEEKAVSA